MRRIVARPFTRSLALSFASALLAGLAACASSPYHAKGMTGGYGETQLDSNIFRVTYRGGIHQRQSETDEMALLRSAEVAAQNGYRYFTSSGAAPTGSAMSLATNVVSIPATTITIVCYRTRPDTDGLVYEAAQVIDSLGPRYGRL